MTHKTAAAINIWALVVCGALFIHGVKHDNDSRSLLAAAGVAVFMFAFSTWCQENVHE